MCKHIRASSLCLSRECFALGLELMVKLTTFITVFIFNLKAEACDYGNWRYISDARLWCSANRNALCQLANQSRLCLSEGVFFLENDVLARVGAYRDYNNVKYVKNVFFEH